MDNVDIFQVILITARKLDKSNLILAPSDLGNKSEQFKDMLRSISSPLLNFYTVNTGRNIFYSVRIRDRIKINIMN
jgi:hypothetical protein